MTSIETPIVTQSKLAQAARKNDPLGNLLRDLGIGGWSYTGREEFGNLQPQVDRVFGEDAAQLKEPTKAVLQRLNQLFGHSDSQTDTALIHAGMRSSLLERPKEVLELFVRYGPIASDLFQTFRQNTLSTVLQNLTFFDRYIDLIQKPATELYAPDFLAAYSPTFLKVSSVGHFSSDYLRQHGDKLIELFKLTSPQLSRTAACLPKEDFAVNPHKYLELAQRWGSDSAAFFKAFRQEACEVARQHADYFEKVWQVFKKDDGEHEFARAIMHINKELLCQHKPFLLTALELCKTAYAELALGLSNEALRPHIQLVAQILPYIKHVPSKVLLAIKPETAAKHPELIKLLVKTCGNNASYVLERIPGNCTSATTAKIEAILKVHGRHAYGIILALFDGQLSKEATLRPVLKKLQKLMPFGLGEFARLVPHGLWATRGETYGRLYGDAAGFVYEAQIHRFTRGEKAHYTELLKQNRKKFGLTAMHRYCLRKLSNLDVSVLEENLKNLDINHKKELPLTVFLLARGDHCNAFSNSTFASAQRLNNTNKVLIFEVGNFTEMRKVRKLLAHLQKAGLQKISRLVVTAHGDKALVELSQRKGPGHRITRSKIHILTSWNKLMARPSEMILDACLTAKHGKRGKNFAAAAARRMPNTTIHAARGLSYSNRFAPVENADEFRPTFGLPPSKRVTFQARGSKS